MFSEILCVSVDNDFMISISSFVSGNVCSDSVCAVYIEPLRYWDFGYSVLSALKCSNSGGLLDVCVCVCVCVRVSQLWL